MAICGPSLKICRDAAPAGLCPGVSLGLAAVKVGNDLSGSTLIHPSLHKLFQVLVGLQGDLVWNAIALDHQIGTLLRTQRPTDPVEARPMTPSHCPSVAGPGIISKFLGHNMLVEALHLTPWKGLLHQLPDPLHVGRLDRSSRRAPFRLAPCTMGSSTAFISWTWIVSGKCDDTHSLCTARHFHAYVTQDLKPQEITWRAAMPPKRPIVTTRSSCLSSWELPPELPLGGLDPCPASPTDARRCM